MRSYLLFSLLLTTLPCIAQPVRVEINAQGQLLRGGEPYFVKGAGGETQLPLLAARGANSLRTWSTRNMASTLAEAEKLGLTVSAGIWLESECSWFSYANPQHCEKQLLRVKEEVQQSKDHPALLAWGIGNESEGDGSNAAYWQQIERLARMVKEIDPEHPTFTAVAWLSKAKADGLNAHTPSLDYVGVNTYGGLFSLTRAVQKVGWTRPWLLTEWGPQGFWERPKNSADLPLEQTSTEKAEMMRRGYSEVIRTAKGCLGSYAFVWGWKYEASATWFGLLTHEGDSIASVDVLEEMWSGKKPANAAPQIQPLKGVPKEAVAPGASFTAESSATDTEGDPLTWHWAVLPVLAGHHAGQRPAMPKPVANTVLKTEGHTAQIQAPMKPGHYRLYLWVKDGHHHAATANAPLVVK